MGRANINITAEFVQKTSEIALKAKWNGAKSQKISNELAAFVQFELKNYDLPFYQRLKADKFEYYSNSKFKAWIGGGEKTIKRLIKDKRCSEDLFQVIGYYLFKSKWTLLKQQTFINSKEKEELKAYKRDIDYEVYFDHLHKKCWVISLGITAGFPIGLQDAFYFEVYTKEAPNTYMGLAQVKSVGLDSSLFTFYPVEHKTAYQLQKKVRYLAKPNSVNTNPVLVNFRGEESDKIFLENILSKSTLILVALTDAVDAPFEIRWNKAIDSYVFLEKKRPFNIAILSWNKNSLRAFIKHYLEHIYHWKYLIDLQNSNTRLNPDDIAIKFYNEEEQIVTASDFITLVSGLDRKIPYNVTAQNTSNRLYFCSCLIATENYGVVVSVSNVALPPNVDKEVDLIDDNYAAFEISNDDENFVVNYIKIVLSLEPIKTIPSFFLEELELNSRGERGVSKGVTTRNKIESDWFTKTITVEIKRAL